MIPISKLDFSNFPPLFTLLQISPSYELARLYRSGECSEEFLKLLPKDFEVVLSTYDKFGSVMDITMNHWVRQIPDRYFDRQHVDSPLSTLGFVGVKTEDHLTIESLVSELNDFIDVYKKSYGDSIYQVIAVNIKIGLPILLKNFKFHVKSGRDHLPKKNEIDIENKKVVFQKERMHLTKIRKGVELLMEKISNISLPYWRLGKRVKYSATFDKRIRNKNLQPDEIKEAQVEYGKIVYRAVKKFERMAENASRGKYPCDDKIEYQKFDYPAIQKRINAYNEWLRLTPFVYPVLPPLPEVVTMDEMVRRLNILPFPTEKFEIDNRQIDLF
jgi:hypothetical protein